MDRPRRHQHRPLQPTGAQASSQPQPFQPASARLQEALEVVRQEFESLSQDAALARQQRDELETNVSGQVNELNIIRASLYELEQAHSKARQQYDEENARLRAELAAVRQGQGSSGPPHPGTTVFSSNGGPPGLPPSGIQSDRATTGNGEPYYGRDRERDRDRDRERDRDRDSRDPKRIKSDRPKTDRDRPEYTSGTPSSKQLPAPYPEGGPPAAENKNHYNEADASYPRKDGTDWFAEYPTQDKRTIDVRLVHTLTHESVVCCVRFSADGKYVATGCNRTAQIYDTKTGAKVCVLADETANKTGDLYIRSVCYSPDGKFLATGAEDKQIRIWDIQKKKIRNIFTGHQQEIYSLDFSRDGRLIVSGSGDRTARIWDMQTSDQKVLTINEPETVDAGVTSVAISKDGRLVAAGSLDTIVRIWDVQSGQLIERLNGHRDSVYSVAFTPDGMGLVSGSLDKTLKHWDLSPLIRRSERERNTPLQQGGTTPSSQGKKEGGEKGSVCTQNFIGHKDYVLSVAVSHDGKWIVSGSKDRCVQFWDARSAQWQLMLQGHKNSVISIDLSPMNNLLATGSGDTQARIWSFNVPA